MKRCPSCGAKNKDTFEYCVRCSESLAAVPSASSTPETRRGLGTYLVVSGLVFVTAVIAWQALRGSSSPSEGDQPALESRSSEAPTALPPPPAGEGEFDAGAARESLRNGIAAFRRGEYEEAVRYLESFVAEAPENATGQMYLGLAQYYSNDLKSASETMSRAFERTPTDPLIRNYLFVMLKQQGDYVSAERVVRQYLDEVPGDAEARRELGQALRLQGKNDESIEELKRLAESQPQSRDTTLELAESLKSSGRFGEAVDEFRRAAEIDPQSAPIQHAIGVTELMAKKYSEAVDPLKKAVEMDGQNADFHFSLAQAYENLDRFEESYAEYEAFVKLKPNDPKAEKIKELLVQARKALAEKQAADKSRAKKSS